jgi:hypothetical protein
VVEAGATVSVNKRNTNIVTAPSVDPITITSRRRRAKSACQLQPSLRIRDRIIKVINLNELTITQFILCALDDISPVNTKAADENG